MAKLRRPDVARVLIVDECPNMRQVFRRFIQRRYHAECVEAKDGLASLRIIATKRLALIITNHEMPRMNGLQLTARLKAHPVTSGLPVIFCSGALNATLRADATEAGAEAFLPKPFELESLYELLDAHLVRR